MLAPFASMPQRCFGKLGELQYLTLGKVTATETCRSLDGDEAKLFLEEKLCHPPCF